MAEYETYQFTSVQENIEKIVLENITTVTLNTDVLRINFEAIVSILKGLAKRIDQGQNGANQTSKEVHDLRERLEKLEDKQRLDKDELNEKIFNNDKEIKSVQEQTDKNTKDIQSLLDSVKELRENQNHNATDLKSIKERLDEHDKKIQELMRKLADGNNSNNGADIAEIQKLLEDYVKKDEFNSYKGQTDNQLQSHQESIDDLYKQLKTLVSEKLSCETFDDHLKDYNHIKNIVISLANNKGDVVQPIVQAGPSLSTKDANLLKELGQRFPEIEAMLKKLQKDLSEHLQNYKVFSEETHKKIQISEENLKVYKTETNKRLAELEAAFKNLRDQLTNFNSNSGKGSESSVDSRKLQMAITALTERLNNFEKELLEIQKRLNNVQDLANENRTKIGNIEEELVELRNLKARVELLEQLLRDKDQGHKFKGPKGSSFEIGGGGVTLEQVKQIVDEEIRKLRDELMALIEALKAALDKKAEAEDLWKSEAALLEKLDQIAGALMKRAQADKNDTKKALMFLEKKIDELRLIVLGGPSNSEEGAIFAKRPWTPWSCASCDNKLKDYPGPLIDHKNWNKMPQRETSPGRMTQGKFGKGWSKWVETKRTTVEKSRDPFFASPNKMGEGLPEIQREGGKSQMDSERVHE